MYLFECFRSLPCWSRCPAGKQDIQLGITKHRPVGHEDGCIVFLLYCWVPIHWSITSIKQLTNLPCYESCTPWSSLLMCMEHIESFWVLVASRITVYWKLVISTTLSQVLACLATHSTLCSTKWFCLLKDKCEWVLCCLWVVPYSCFFVLAVILHLLLDDQSIFTNNTNSRKFVI